MRCTYVHGKIKKWNSTHPILYLHTITLFPLLFIWCAQYAGSNKFCHIIWQCMNALFLVYKPLTDAVLLQQFYRSDTCLSGCWDNKHPYTTWNRNLGAPKNNLGEACVLLEVKYPYLQVKEDREVIWIKYMLVTDLFCNHGTNSFHRFIYVPQNSRYTAIPYDSSTKAASSKADSTFTTAGFYNWTKVVERFKEHESSHAHRNTLATSWNMQVNQIVFQSKQRSSLIKQLAALRYLLCQVYLMLTQQCFNHCFTLHAHCQKIDNLDLKEIAQEIVERNGRKQALLADMTIRLSCMCALSGSSFQHTSLQNMHPMI